MMNDVLSSINKGEIILYPTDTVWGLGCDATNEKAVSNIYKIKKREASKSLIVLVSSFAMLSKHVDVPSKAKDLISTLEKPTTIIYTNPRGIARNIINKEDNSLAIRIVKDDFCRELIIRLGKPLVSTSANISGNPTPKSFREIEKGILDSVDYIVNLRQEEIATKSSTILKIEGEEVVMIRE